jgi:hypothetical protein
MRPDASCTGLQDMTTGVEHLFALLNFRPQLESRPGRLRRCVALLGAYM